MGWYIGRAAVSDVSSQSLTEFRIVNSSKGNSAKLLDFKVIGEPLDSLLVAAGNKLTREWPARYRGAIGGRELLVIHIRVARLSYRSALYLGGDKPPDARRLSEFAVSLPLLNRSILESLFTVLFILEDVPNRCAWFREADYRESKQEFDRYQSEYGTSAEWQSHLEYFANAVQMGLSLTTLSASQAANPRGLRSWPTPGAMATYGVSPSMPLTTVQAFMKYLNDFFYIDLSQQAHLGGWGIAKRAGFLLDEFRQIPGTEATLTKFRRSQIGQAVALVLALVSEVESHFNFGLRQQIVFVWNLAASTFAIVDEMFQKRYRDLLA